ncbi:MAG: DUF2846 domain-containing protein [Pyrinomonadaceae bacterium]
MQRIILCFLFTIFLIVPVVAQSSTPTPPEMATVYFYRVEEVNALASRKVEVKLEGKELLKMPEDNFVGFRFTPGKYGLRMRQKQSEILLSVEAGKRYFVRVSQKTAGYFLDQSLALIPEEQAIYQMRDMKVLEGKNIKDTSKEVIKEKPTSPSKP